MFLQIYFIKLFLQIFSDFLSFSANPDFNLQKLLQHKRHVSVFVHLKICKALTYLIHTLNSGQMRGVVCLLFVNNANNRFCSLDKKRSI